MPPDRALGDGELPGSRLRISDSIGEFHWRHGFAQAKACAIRVGKRTCLLGIFINNNKGRQLLTTTTNSAQQCNRMAIFTESHDSDIQLTVSSANDL